MQPKRKPKAVKPKILVKTIRSPAKLAKASFHRGQRLAKGEVEEQRHTSPSNYAIDRSGEITIQAASKAVNTAHWAVKQIPAPKLRTPASLHEVVTAQRVGKAQPRPRTQRPDASQPPQVRIRQAQLRRLQQKRQATHAVLRQASHHVPRVHNALHATSQTGALDPSGGKRSIKAVTRATKIPKQAIKAGVKMPKAGKAAVKSGKVAVKTIQTTAKSAQAAGKTARFTAHAAKKVAIVGAKLVVRATLALARMVAVAAKAVMALLSAGGGVVVVILIAAAAIMALLTSVFGVFFSNEVVDGLPMTQAIVDINTEFTNDLQARIDALSNGGSYDSIIVSYDGDYDGDSAMVNNWQDVLGVYAVKTVSDEDAGTEVITLNPEKIEELKKVFTDMNEVEIVTREETNTTYDENDESVTNTTLYIDIRIRSMAYLEGATLYNFNEKKLEMLEELMSPEYYELFAALLGVDLLGGLSASDLTDIMSGLPTGTKGAAIVEAAVAVVGTPYSKMDCSQLSRYAYAQVGVSLPRTSVEQAKYCYNNGYMIGAGELQPGDLVFWSKNSCSCGRYEEIHHAGVYIGGGKIVDASSSKGRVVLRNLWSGSNWSIWGYARPHV